MELLGLDRAELIALCEKLGQPAFRGRQIADWLYKKAARSIAEMTNLPAAMREGLARIATLTRAEIVTESKAPDGTTKYLLELGDGETIESVLLPYADRVSVCVSTQAGCPAGCLFCATAMCGFIRNLTAGEIVDQVLALQSSGGRRVTHVVFMGMGEPLMNFDNVIKALHLLNDEVGIGMRRMTVSTVGLPAAIRKLAELDLQITLAVSLHAPDDTLRRQLIPISASYALAELMQTCRKYADLTKRRITFEYLLLAGVNDSPAQAAALAKLLHRILCNVNLIPFNEVEDIPYKRPLRASVAAFRAVLEEAGIEVTQRMERGHSISAACGQLRRRTSA
jgi:23S rRNA (adenine2503-C2)-methyltransferase